MITRCNADFQSIIKVGSVAKETCQNLNGSETKLNGSINPLK